MAEHIRKCVDDQGYTLEKNCPICGKETILPRPPKFSLPDKYASLRRESKKTGLQEKGLF
ncbi:MAG: nucleolar RNA-binding Nop10p family protein [Nanoarchaeota archaeon]|nr:nucleolar RNA-binding Nop10p family protein [Nanoarchaeota archaeon]